MSTGVKILWVIAVAVFVGFCALPFLGIKEDLLSSGMGKTNAVLIAIYGNNNKVFIVYDGSKKEPAGLALDGNDETKTVVVNNGPLSLSFRGDRNRVVIDDEIQRKVTVQDVGLGNVYAFSD